MRVRLASIYSNLRKRIKAGTGKLNVVSYSPVVYKIVRKIAANPEQLGYASYIVADANDKIILTSNGRAHRFKFNELQAVPNGLTIHTPLTQETANRLNRVKDSGEVVEQDPVPMAAAPLPKQEKPIADWIVSDWNKALRGNFYLDNGINTCIMGVVHGVGGLFIRSCLATSLEKEGTPRKDADVVREPLRVGLERGRGAAWFTGEFASYLDD